jgi:hypothetical protein
VTGALEKKTQAVHIFAFIVATASGFEHASPDSRAHLPRRPLQMRNADGNYVLLGILAVLHSNAVGHLEAVAEIPL